MMAGFLKRIGGKYPGYQAVAHGTCGECRLPWCPCHQGMRSQFWADRRYGGPEITKMLAENWIFRLRARLRAAQAERTPPQQRFEWVSVEAES